MSRSGHLAALAIAAALAACGAETPDSRTTSPSASTQPTSTVPTTVPTSSTRAIVPDAFAGREPFPDCGDDQSTALDPMGPPSRMRQCFFDANARRKPAELTSSDATGTYVYRTRPDGTIEVFVVGPDGGDGWATFRCAGLSPDERLVFELAGCEEPIELD